MPATNTHFEQAAQAFRDGDRNQVTRLVNEALLAARATLEPIEVAYALRHIADLRSKMAAQAEAAAHIEEAIAIYRERGDTHTLDLANALRVAALNHERAALASWNEAKRLYSSVDVQAGVDGSRASPSATVRHTRRHLVTNQHPTLTGADILWATLAAAHSRDR